MTTLTPQTFEMPPMVTAADVARQLHVSERTVQRLAASHAIPHHRIGTVLRFSAEDVAQIIETTSIAPESAAPAPSPATHPPVADRGGRRSPQPQETPS